VEFDMTPPLTPDAARSYAERWIANWNRKDVEAVLAHFSDHVVFTSMRAQSVTGSARIEGKTSLRDYWTRAIAQIHAIHFTLDYVLSEGNRIGIVYTAEIDEKRLRAAEFLTFGDEGLIREGEAMYGATV
jgi:hypothetical protein